MYPLQVCDRDKTGNPELWIHNAITDTWMNWGNEFLDEERSQSFVNESTYFVVSHVYAISKNKHTGHFRITLSFSGTLIPQNKYYWHVLLDNNGRLLKQAPLSTSDFLLFLDRSVTLRKKLHDELFH